MQPDLAPGFHSQRLGDQRALPERPVHQHQRRRLARAVELADEGAEDGLGRIVRPVAREECTVAVVLARAEEEHLDAGLPRLDVDGHHVRVPHRGQVDALAHLDVGERLDAVAEGRRGLEFQRVAGRGHALGEPALHLLAAPGEEGAGLVDQPVVVGLGDAADAGRGAALDLVLQAGPRAALQHRIRARAQRKGALQRVDGEVHRAGRSEGAEVVAACTLGAAVLGDLRPGVVAAEQDIGEGLVVAEQDVVVRLEPLDHVALEQQRLDLALGGDDLDRGGAGDHALQAHRQRADVDVGLDPLAQALGLADVERLLVPVAHAVDAGARRHRRQRLAQRRDSALQRDAGIGEGRRIVRDGRGRPLDLHVHHRVIRLMRHVA